MDLIVRLLQPRRIIEIGAFIGLSAMTMARAMPAGGKLTTIEKFDHFAAGGVPGTLELPGVEGMVRRAKIVRNGSDIVV